MTILHITIIRDISHIFVLINQTRLLGSIQIHILDLIQPVNLLLSRLHAVEPHIFQLYVSTYVGPSMHYLTARPNLAFYMESIEKDDHNKSLVPNSF